MTLIGARRWRVEVKRGHKYAHISIDLFPTPYDLTAEGVEELHKLISNYIISRKTHRKIIGQYYCTGPTYIAFTALIEDVNRLIAEVENIIVANLKEIS